MNAREYFDKLNLKAVTKPFWKTCKLYFPNKHWYGGCKITLIVEKIKTVWENHKISKAFNTCFKSATDSLNLFEWVKKIGKIIVKFSKHPSIFKIKQKVKASAGEISVDILKNPEFCFSELTNVSIKPLMRITSLIL